MATQGKTDRGLIGAAVIGVLVLIAALEELSHAS
ncbi:MAG: hypothetical protein H0W55_11910 [Actinobacteria bacterium]|nr:hypothetical protein [Actinomycetota bacterium]